LQGENDANDLIQKRRSSKKKYKNSITKDKVLPDIPSALMSPNTTHNVQT
jgi:hypothetical protein